MSLVLVHAKPQALLNPFKLGSYGMHRYTYACSFFIVIHKTLLLGEQGKWKTRMLTDAVPETKTNAETETATETKDVYP